MGTRRPLGDFQHSIPPVAIHRQTLLDFISSHFSFIRNWVFLGAGWLCSQCKLLPKLCSGGKLMFQLICQTDLVTEITQISDSEIIFVKLTFFLVRRMKPHGRVSLVKVKLLSAFLWIGSGLCGVQGRSTSQFPSLPHNLCDPHRCLVQGGKQNHPSSCLVLIVLPCCALRAFLWGSCIFYASVIVTVVNLSIQLGIFIFIPMQQRAVTQSVYDTVMVQPQPAAVSHSCLFTPPPVGSGRELKW